MAIEKVQAQIIAEVDDQSFKQAWNEVKLFARDTKKELDKSFLFQLQLDKANTKIQLDQARSLLRKAKKDWDKEMILKITLKTEELQSKLTEAWRRLNNFRNTWETSVSRLWRLFDWLSNKVGWMVSHLWKLLVVVWVVGWLWAKALMLGDKLEQANISFTTMLGSAEQAKTLLEDSAVGSALLVVKVTLAEPAIDFDKKPAVKASTVSKFVLVLFPQVFALEPVSINSSFKLLEYVLAILV